VLSAVWKNCMGASAMALARPLPIAFAYQIFAAKTPSIVMQGLKSGEKKLI